MYALLIFSKTPGKTRWGGAFNKLNHTYDNIISLDNLLEAWKEFVRGKRKRKDVQNFQLHLMDNVLALHNDLKNKTYKHSLYEYFRITDPKIRDIHKACVRDRLLHYAVYRMLYPFFDTLFTADSYSCRLGKGNHKALNWFREFAYVESKNRTKSVWVLKCDIRKFFANINHNSLRYIVMKYIEDEDVNWLLSKIIESFRSTREGIGLPLGNLTSQLFVNIYMNEFDQFVKRELKIKHYIRFADDFVILSSDKERLEKILLEIKKFLKDKLKLEVHPNKVFIKSLVSGVDFLGWVHFPDHRVLRTITKRRMLKNLTNNPSSETVVSYVGLLKHGNTYHLKQLLEMEEDL